MKSQVRYFHCGDRLLDALAGEVADVHDVVASVYWIASFSHGTSDAVREHQAGYNRAFATEFGARGWESQPRLRSEPRLIGDFQKGLVFVEVQFGNSATLYRDYYKFQYGAANGLLSLAVLVVPTKPRAFFPTRPASVGNMAEYALAETCLSVLPIDVPTMLVGLVPEN